jgi:hypothetical protein
VVDCDCHLCSGQIRKSADLDWDSDLVHNTETNA